MMGSPQASGPSKAGETPPARRRRGHDEGRASRADDYGPWRSRPVAADEDPAAVMIGRPARERRRATSTEARIPDPAAGAVAPSRRTPRAPTRSVLLTVRQLPCWSSSSVPYVRGHVAGARGAMTCPCVRCSSDPTGSAPAPHPSRRAAIGPGDHDLLVAGDLCRPRPPQGSSGDATAVRPERRRIRLHFPR